MPLSLLRSTLKPHRESQKPGFELKDKWNNCWQSITEDILTTLWQQDVLTKIFIQNIFVLKINRITVDTVQVYNYAYKCISVLLVYKCIIFTLAS